MESLGSMRQVDTDDWSDGEQDADGGFLDLGDDVCDTEECFRKGKSERYLSNLWNGLSTTGE